MKKLFTYIPISLMLSLLIISCAGNRNNEEINPELLSEIEKKILNIYSSEDAKAISKMGAGLEENRPPLTLKLLKKVYKKLRKTSDYPVALKTVRTMVFRSVSILVGKESIPLLKECKKEDKTFGTYCAETMDEVWLHENK